MIQIKNIGPIESVSIPVPAEGGVVVLHGRNGTGKSTALDAIQSAVTGKGKPPLKDLAAKGEVRAAGVTLTVAKSIRRSGELEVTALDSRLSIADLVDPGIADAARADAARIKALVNLSGASIEPGDLHGFPENLLEGLNLADPVAAMADLKRRLDIGAREYEKLATEVGAKAEALRGETGDDPPEPPDEFLLHDALADAQRRIDRLNFLAEQAHVAKEKGAVAEAMLASVEREDVAALEVKLQRAVAVVEDRRGQAETLKAELAATVERYQEARSHQTLMEQSLKDACQSAELRAQLEAQIAASQIDPPTPKARAAALGDYEAARLALESAARQRIVRENYLKSVELAEESDRLGQEATALRRKARQTEELLSEIIADLGTSVMVVDGRLVTDTLRGPTYFGELSEGERWKMALDIAVKAVGAGGLIVVPQAAWEGLDPVNRSLIANHAKSSGVVVVTAEADDGPLAATLF